MTREELLYEGEEATGYFELLGGEGTSPKGNMFGETEESRPLDIKRINDFLNRVDFSLPSSWYDHCYRRDTIDNYARYRLSVVQNIQSSDDSEYLGCLDFSDDDFAKKVNERPPLYRHVASTKIGGAFPVRPDLEPILHLLDIANDVSTFRTFPTRINWRSGSNGMVTFADFQIRGKGRTYTDILIALDQEEQELALWLRDMGAPITVISPAIMKDVVVQNCKAVFLNKSHEPGRIPGRVQYERFEYASHFSSVASSMGDHTLTGEQAVLAAVAQGRLGMDFGVDYHRSKVGNPNITGKTCSFWTVAMKYIVA